MAIIYVREKGMTTGVSGDSQNETVVVKYEIETDGEPDGILNVRGECVRLGLLPAYGTELDGINYPGYLCRSLEMTPVDDTVGRNQHFVASAKFTNEPVDIPEQQDPERHDPDDPEEDLPSVTYGSQDMQTAETTDINGITYMNSARDLFESIPERKLKVAVIRIKWKTCSPPVGYYNYLETVNSREVYICGIRCLPRLAKFANFDISGPSVRFKSIPAYAGTFTRTEYYDVMCEYHIMPVIELTDDQTGDLEADTWRLKQWLPDVRQRYITDYDPAVHYVKYDAEGRVIDPNALIRYRDWDPLVLDAGRRIQEQFNKSVRWRETYSASAEYAQCDIVRYWHEGRAEYYQALAPNGPNTPGGQQEPRLQPSNDQNTAFWDELGISSDDQIASGIHYYKRAIRYEDMGLAKCEGGEKDVTDAVLLNGRGLPLSLEQLNNPGNDSANPYMFHFTEFRQVDFANFLPWTADAQEFPQSPNGIGTGNPCYSYVSTVPRP